MSSDEKFGKIIDFIRVIYGPGPIPLHRPVFLGNEKNYLSECIDSNFVSSVGPMVAEFELKVAEFTGANFAVAMVNGTSALHIALELASVGRGDEVITQALTFVATCNAIQYIGASPVFIDVDIDTMGMSPIALQSFLLEHVELQNGVAINKTTGKRVAACIPMHTFGVPCRISEITDICKEWGIYLIEDAAEGLGSYAKGKHVGNFGGIGTLSFNGNKIITSGGGGMLITSNPEIAIKAKHLSTTAKTPHPYEYFHDTIGYNYRLPNINAALGCAQLENIQYILGKKAEVTNAYKTFFKSIGVDFMTALSGDVSNNWLNAIICRDLNERDAFLNFTNDLDVMTRPIWCLMNRLPMFKNFQNDGLVNSKWLETRVVNLPSSVPDQVITLNNI